MEPQHGCRECDTHNNVQPYVDTASGEIVSMCAKCADARGNMEPRTDWRTCVKCEHVVSKLDTWAEIDPRTNKTVYMCDACYNVQPAPRVRVIISVHFMERRTTLDMLEIAHDVYAYRVTYHRFDDYMQIEHTVSEFSLQWVRDAFNAMNHVYDDLSVCATETYMDCDTCNQ